MNGQFQGIGVQMSLRPTTMSANGGEQETIRKTKAGEVDAEQTLLEPTLQRV